MLPASSLRNIRLLSYFNFFTDFRLFGPILIIYFAEVSGSYFVGGAVFATTMISSAIFEIPTGVLSDRLPRTRVAALGGLVTAFAIIAYAAAPGAEILLLGAVLEGLGRSLFSGNNEALLWDSLAEHDREDEFHHHSGRVNAAFQIALASSALIGGFVADWSMRWAVALSIVPQFMSVVAALLMKEPAVHHNVEPVHPMRQVARAARNIVRHKELRRLTLAGAVSHGAGESGWQFQPAFVALLWPTWAVGVGRAMNHAISIAGFWWAGRIIERLGSRTTLLGGSLLATIVGFVAYGKPTAVSPLLTTVEGGLYGATSTAKSTLLQQSFTDTERATMGSIGQLLGSLLFGLFALLAGAVADAHGPQAALLICQAIGCLALPGYWLLQRSHRRE